MSTKSNKYAKTRKTRPRAQSNYRAPMYRAPRTKIVYRDRPARESKSKNDNTFLGIEKPNSLGANIGSFVGHGAQKLFSFLSGFGDYHVEKNSLLEGGMSPPQIINTVNKNGFIVRHREYIADITASTTFVNRTYDINPGLSGSFPYLSQIAKAFELYRMRGLVYEFKSMSSDSVLSSGASTALGTVALATQYNSLSAPFTNLIALENHEFSNACKPSCDMLHPVECKKSLVSVSELYTRTGSVPDNADIRLYDLGQLNVATSGMQNAVGVIGQLWCTYEIEFYQAKYDAPTSILSEHIANFSTSSTNWLGTTHSFSTGNSLGVGIEPNVITFPNNIRDGTFQITCFWKGGAPGLWVKPGFLQGPDSSYANIKIVWDDATQGYASAPADSVTASNWFMYSVIVEILKPNATFTFSGGNMVAGEGDLWITQVDADINT